MLIEAAKTSYYFKDCTDAAPDGGPVCRKWTITCVAKVPTNDADQLNGVREKEFVRAKYALYSSEHWSEDNVAAQFLRTNKGWTVSTMTVSYHDMDIEGYTRCRK
jgi:hypothetical protein